MTKKKAAVDDWENAKGEFSQDDFESLPSGLAPLWKPEEGDTIFFTPETVHPFKQKKGKTKGKKGTKNNFAIEGTFVGGETMNFFSGKNKAATIKPGSKVTLGSSYNMY
jgi:hypothetical protein